jgi:alanyl-tRNA synthetase
MAYRVVADHIRTLSFAIVDGAVPSNEGRGYVLRRVLRRAVRYGIQTLGAKPGFFSKLVPALVKEMAGFYPELAKKSDLITAVLMEEERAFTSLLERGVKFFTEMVTDIKGTGGSLIGGEQAFFLYDTLGFPIDLTQLMAAEQGLSVDIAGFQAALESQKSVSIAHILVKFDIEI